MKIIARTILVLLAAATAAQADVKLPAIFGDHMVVQRGMKVPIWGKADPGEKVDVKVLKQDQSATADDKGKWKVTLDPIESAEPIAITVAGKNTVTINDVLVGEVWICSGQSNMEFRLDQSSTAKDALAGSDQPQMRLFVVKHAFGPEPMDDVQGDWKVCNADTAQHFSAVGYFFGLALHQKLNNVPVGLIETNWGGTRADAWMPKAAYDRLTLPYEPAATEFYLHPPAVNPAGNWKLKAQPHQVASAIFNGMINPLVGYGIRGVIWYQGETNADIPQQAEPYHEVLGSMITSWRSLWGQGDFPFLMVQLANFKDSPGWPVVREAQAKLASELPNAGLAVAIDIGNSKDIHPKNKAEVGRRLALVAEKVAYGQDVSYSGPTFKAVKFDGDKAIVSFDHVDGGLVSKGDALAGFEIAGEDGKFVPATAKIDGETVVLTADGVASPKAVRYGWADDPTCTLYNKTSDLPAVPFGSQK